MKWMWKSTDDIRVEKQESIIVNLRVAHPKTQCVIVDKSFTVLGHTSFIRSLFPRSS